jgi:hypothetical protein
MSSTFKELVPCSDSRCKDCTTESATQCDLWYDEISVDAPCLLWASSDPGCLQWDSTDTAICLIWSDGYGLNQWTSVWDQCTETNCGTCTINRVEVPVEPVDPVDPDVPVDPDIPVDPDAPVDPEVVVDPVYEYTQVCDSCIDKYVFNSTDSTCTSCNQVTLPWDEGECLQWALSLTWEVCEDGFFLSDTATACKRACTTGTFSTITVNAVTSIIESKVWSTCPDECSVCNGIDPTINCLEWPEGQYLSVTDSISLSGEWLAVTDATASINIFVSNNAAWISSGTTPDGTITQPFYDLQDALNYAYEQSAPNSNLQVHIHLWSGTHYLIHSPSWHYDYTQYKNDNAVNHEITISPLYWSYSDPGGAVISSYCVSSGTQVTVVNKRANRFRIDGGKMLTITDIIFDSLDSLLPPEDSTALTCLNTRAKWCKIADDGSITNDTISDASLCTKDIVSDEECTLTSYE